MKELFLFIWLFLGNPYVEMPALYKATWVVHNIAICAGAMVSVFYYSGRIVLKVGEFH